MKAQDLIQRAFRLIGLYQPGEALSNEDASAGLQALNDMLDAWTIDRLTIYQILRSTPFNLTSGMGGPTAPITIGTNGDIALPRPTFIPNAEIQVTVPAPNTDFEYPLEILKPDEYARISIKALPSALCTALYYDHAFPQTGADKGLGNLYLYPVPNGEQTIALVLYLPTPLAQFADLDTTDYSLPPGYAEALRYQLALRLSAEYPVAQLPPSFAALAVQSFALIKRANAKNIIPPLINDVPSGQAAGLYNWRTGEFSKRGGYF